MTPIDHQASSPKRRHLPNQKLRQDDWKGLRVWLIGASSGIGAALAVDLGKLGAELVLSARNADGLESVANTCRQLAKAKVHVLPFDVCDNTAMTAVVETVRRKLDGIDLVLFNAGTYQETRIDTLTCSGAADAVTINLLAPINATVAILPMLLQMPDDGRVRGFAYVASVAGYRGLPRALTYGPGKAGLISFVESLWGDLRGLGLNTWLINPGFVRTRLTAQNSFDMPALITPEIAARDIINGFARGAFEIHFPKRFTYAMKLIRLLPINWFLRLTMRLVPPLDRKAMQSSHQPTKE